MNVPDCILARLYTADSEVVCYECLDEHLALASLLAYASYLRLRWIRARESDPKVLREALFAAMSGLFHDAAKSCGEYQKRREEGKLSFGSPPHEEVSACIVNSVAGLWVGVSENPLEYAMTACLNGQGPTSTELYYYVYVPVRYHHQALRLIERIGERPPEESVPRIQGFVRRNVEVISETLKGAASRALEYLEVAGSSLPDKAVRSFTLFMEKLRDMPALTENDINCQKVGPISGTPYHSLVSRIISGSLILADYASTVLNLRAVDERCISDSPVASDVQLFMRTVLGNLYSQLEKHFG